MYFDYDFVARRRTEYESATTLYPLWAGLASPEQARRIAEAALPLFEAAGGLVSGTEASRGPVSAERPQRQWDYPFGWPPHQMLAWQGLRDYGHREAAARLAYRWLLMITRNAADYNGTVPEKYDVVNRTHQVFVEYGNVGTEFAYITKEGFGWMNASYQVGLAMLTPEQRGQLEALAPVEAVFGAR
jgi:alpha,alpha-trehalase